MLVDGTVNELDAKSKLLPELTGTSVKGRILAPADRLLLRTAQKMRGVSKHIMCHQHLFTSVSNLKFNKYYIAKF